MFAERITPQPIVYVSPRVKGILLLCLALLLPGCVNEGNEPVQETGSVTATSERGATAPSDDAGEATHYAVDQDTVVVARFADVGTLDLQMGVSFNDYHTLTNVYDGLTRRAPDGSLEPSIATDWELSEDGLTWTIQVREGVLFHNGEPLTADDVVYSISRLADDNFPGPMGVLHDSVVGVEAVDDWVVEIRFDVSDPLYMQNSPSYTPIIPRSVGESVDVLEFGQSVETAIGSGPYRIVSWEPDDRMVLEAFEDHWRGAASIKNAIFRPISDESARVAALRAGETDITEALPIEEANLLEGVEGYEARITSGLNRQRLVLNTNNPPFDQRANRLAVNLAIDIPGIIDGVLGGLGEELAGYGVPGVEVGANDELVPYGYDPERARELLTEAGNPDGFTVDFLVNLGYEKAEEVAQAIAAQLAEIGIRAEITALNPDDFNRIQGEGGVEMGFTGHGGGSLFHVDLGLTAIWDCERGNPTFNKYWCSEEYTQILVDALNLLAEDDVEGSIAKYYEAQQMLYDEVVFVPLYAVPFVFGVNEALNFEVAGDGNLWMYNASWK